MYEQEIEQLQAMIEESSRIVFFRRRRRIDGERDPGFSKRRRGLSSGIPVFTGRSGQSQLFCETSGSIL